MHKALADLFGGRAPSAQDLEAAAPVILGVLCGQDKAATRKYAGALASALCDLARSGPVDVAQESIRALEHHKTELRSSADKMAQLTTALTSALVRFTAAKKWRGVRIAVRIMWSFFFNTPDKPPPALLEAAARAVRQGTLDCARVYRDEDAIWRRAYNVALLDKNRVCTVDLGHAWNVVVRDMAVAYAVSGYDMGLLYDVATAIIGVRNRARDVTELGFEPIKALVIKHRGAVPEELLSLFWDMTFRLGDDDFAELVTCHECLFQKLQDVWGWSELKTVQERIRRLGKTWPVSVAEAEARAAETAKRADAAEQKTVEAEQRAAEAEQRAAEAEHKAAEVEARNVRLTEAVRKNLSRLLDMQCTGDDARLHDSCARSAAAAELMAAPDSPAATGAPAQGCGDTIMYVPGCVAQVRVLPVETSLHDTVAGAESEPAGNHNGELSASTERVASASTDPVQETPVAVHNVPDAVADAVPNAVPDATATETTVNGLTPASDPAVRALPCVLCVFGFKGAGKTTLGKQLAAIPGYHVLDHDGGRTTWPKWSAVDYAVGTHTIVVMCHGSMRGPLALFPEYGGVVYHCYLVHDADACNHFERMYSYCGIGHQVVMHRAASSSSDCPTWTVRRVHDRAPWLADVRQAF